MDHVCGGGGGTTHAISRLLLSPILWCGWAQDGQTLVISFEKAVETWWPCVIKGHAEIDTQKVDSTKRVEEYDEETQAAIRKIMFDQAQKAKGLPTSEELSMDAMMQRAMGAPGAPPMFASEPK